MIRRRLADADRVLVVAHGQLGGNGRLHATARACGLPVLGPSEIAIARAHDKLWARRQLSHANLPVPRTLEVKNSRSAPSLGDDKEAQSSDLARLGWPCVVKPRYGGTEAGTRRLTSPASIREAIAESSAGELLLEREVHGRALSVIVIDGEVLGVAEIEESTNQRGQRIEILSCPAQLSRCQRAGVENLGRRACAALHLSDGPTRVDLILSERGNEVILDVEPLPRLHRDGVVARVARAAGLSYPHLCAQLLERREPCEGRGVRPAGELDA
ncbi:ATP-grasp domain-containing protein [Enhygromyxa salina]|uniref:ATP-grasp domain-containing protein n=1 Tax=Enhygromyxa salina TaxID=215803 RepID=UPI0015E61C80|nr:ATP-grasp domain-containing protein [Enhygromyxa salina]